MFVVRPSVIEDLEQIVELAHQAGPGMTNLPKDQALLKNKIQKSINSFAINPTKAGAESYLFVIENLDDNNIIGTSEIHSKIGGFEPFYSYHIEKAIHQSKNLKINKEIDVLKLATEHNGPSEICTLFIDPRFRQKGLGRLASLSRFLFIADNKQRFEDNLLADMRGVINEDGYSPFWEHVVKHFFDMDYNKADLLSATDKRFIADLMPKYPIYIPILPNEVKDVIAKVNKATEPDLKFLYQEGFRFDGHVDIFDAGPRLQCKIEDIRTIKESKTASVKNVIKETKVISNNHDDIRKIDKNKVLILSNTQTDFRSIIAIVDDVPNGSIDISYKAAKALNVKLGDVLRYAPLFPSKKNTEEDEFHHFVREPLMYSI